MQSYPSWAYGGTEEAQTHVLEDRSAIHPQEDTKVQEQDIFETNPKQLITTVKNIAEIIDSVNNVQLTQPRLEPHWDQGMYKKERLWCQGIRLVVPSVVDRWHSICICHLG